MSQKVGFSLDVDISQGASQLQDFERQAEAAVTGAADALSDLTSRSTDAERAIGRVKDAFAQVERAAEAQAKTAMRTAVPVWDRLYGRGAHKDLRDSVDAVRRYHDVLAKAGQAGKAVADIDFDASPDLKKQEESIRRVDKAWQDMLRSPRNARLRSELRGYGADGAGIWDVLGAHIPQIYGRHAPGAAQRLLSDLAFRVGSPAVAPPLSPAGGGGLPSGDGGGGNVLLGGAGFALKRFLPIAAALGAVTTVGGGVSALYGAAEGSARDSLEMDSLLRSITGASESLDDFRTRMFEVGDGLYTTREEAAAFARQFSRLSRDIDPDGLQDQTRGALGFARGAGMDRGTAVRAFAEAQWMGFGGKQGQRDFALLLANTLSSSRMWQRGDEITGMVSAWMQSAASRTIDTPPLEPYLDLITRLTNTERPGVMGSGAGNLLAQADAAIRGGGGRGEASQIFLLDAMARRGGVRGGALEGQYYLEQGMFTRLPSGLSVFDAAMAQIESSFDPGQSMHKTMSIAGLFGLTGKQAEALMGAMSQPGMQSGGFGQFLDRSGIDLSSIQGTAYKDLADLYRSKDPRAMGEKWLADFSGSQSRREDLEGLLRSKQGDDLRSGLAEWIAKGGMVDTTATAIAEEQAKSRDNMGKIGDQLDKTLLSIRELQSTATGAVVDILSFLRGRFGVDEGAGEGGYNPGNWDGSNWNPGNWDGSNWNPGNSNGKNWNPGVYKKPTGKVLPKDAPANMVAMFRAAEQKYGLPPGMLQAMAWQESKFDPEAKSPAGAEGLMQFMPGTADRFGIDPLNPAQAIDGAGRYMQELYREFGDWDLALAGYNAGEHRVREYGGVPPFKETQKYVPSVQGARESLRGSLGVGGNQVSARDGTQRVEVSVIHRREDGSVIARETPPYSVQRPVPWGGS